MTVIDLSNWQPPVPLDERIITPWPRGVFPGPFEEFVSELSRATETPLELAALMMLSTVATITQGLYIVKIKEGYVEPLNIWTCAALPPGSRKSAVQGACVAPLTDWERMQEKHIRPRIQEHESFVRSTEARLRVMRNRAANADKDDYNVLIQEIAQAESAIKEPPVVPQLWTSDVTPENLGVIMAENNERMSILSDEGGIFEILGGRYNRGIPNLDLALKAHSGTPCRVNRGSRPPVFLDSPSLTMGLSPQPSVLEGLARNKAFRGRGLIARFLYALPPSNLGYRTLDEPPMKDDVISNYHRAIQSLIELAQKEEVNEGDKREFKLSKAAYDHWRLHALSVEIRMQQEGIFAQIQDWAGKFPGAIARIAGLLHIMKSFDGTYHGDTIDIDIIKSSITIGGCLQSHALAVFDLMGEDSRRSGARKVLSWIKSEQVIEFTQRDCHYALKSFFKKVDELHPCLELLEDLNYIRRREKERPSHRPSIKFDVNPLLYEEMKEG